MPINMRVKRENGEVVAQSDATWDPPWTLLALGNTPLLAGINTVGMTIFNRVQCQRHLPYEVAFMQDNRDARQAKMLDELDRLIKEVDKRPHRYLWFLGD